MASRPHQQASTHHFGFCDRGWTGGSTGELALVSSLASLLALLPPSGLRIRCKVAVSVSCLSHMDYGLELCLRPTAALRCRLCIVWLSCDCAVLGVTTVSELRA